ncbi:MAG TPA: hypothetical protein VG142_08175 [Trebonia sp.]|jgi:hypothetical protein|nr:hypothetical protein [Trebonia sp.]
MSFGVSADPDDEVLRSQLRERHGASEDRALRLLRETQQRYGGLAFYNPATHFGERMIFEPRPDFGGADDEPWIELIEHTTSIPWSILLRADGSVAYTVTGPGWTPDGVVKVFAHPDALIEDAALHDESASRAWKRSDPAGSSRPSSLCWPASPGPSREKRMSPGGTRSRDDGSSTYSR